MIFIDIGAHEGQTLEEVIRHDWSAIYAFEPAEREFLLLVDRFKQPNLRLLKAALSDRDGRATLYGTNDLMEASLLLGHQDGDPTVQQKVPTLDAAGFFARFVREPAVVKINCEGGEIAILDSLIDSGEITKVHAMLIDFDARKIAGMHDEPDRIRGRLAEVGFDRYRDTWPSGATHQDRVANWLAEVL